MTEERRKDPSENRMLYEIDRRWRGPVNQTQHQAQLDICWLISLARVKDREIEHYRKAYEEQQQMALKAGAEIEQLRTVATETREEGRIKGIDEMRVAMECSGFVEPPSD